MSIEQLADPAGVARAASALCGARRPTAVASAIAHVCAPVGELRGDAIAERLWKPIEQAILDFELRTSLQLAGRFNTADWVAGTGHIAGIFAQPLWSIRPTGRPVFLPFATFDRIENAQVAETYLILDLPALLIAAGQWPLAPPLGQSFPAPAPASGDGIGRAPADAAVSAKSLHLVEAMIAGLMRYDRQSLASMGMRDFWTPAFHWYGPGGIGMARGHGDYERAHQGPFLNAFPDRVGGDHRCRIGDGPYVASTGWPSIRATHLGGGWLGLPPTGRRISMRVMDFWRRDNDLLAENWVFIDILDLALQLDLDILARAAQLRD